MTEKNEEGDYPALVDIENKDPKFVHFYVQHFESVIKETEVRYADLFPEQSKVVKAWDALTYPAKQIYIRLYCRKVIFNLYTSQFIKFNFQIISSSLYGSVRMVWTKDTQKSKIYH